MSAGQTARGPNAHSDPGLAEGMRFALSMVAVANPGVIIGALVSLMFQRLGWRWGWAAGSGIFALINAHYLTPGWTLRVVGAQYGLHTSSVPTGQVALSLMVEALAGGLWLLLWQVARQVEGTSLTEAIHNAARDMQRGGRALGRVSPPRRWLLSCDMAVETGRVKVGVEMEGGRALAFPLRELETGAMVLGVTGSGKSTLLQRLMEQVADQEEDWSIVVVDGKAGGLRKDTMEVARRRNREPYIVDPEYDETMGYNPAVGSPSAVSAKLVGTFDFGSGGAIYQQLAQAAVPTLVRALRATRTEVTLPALLEACSPGRVAELVAAQPQVDPALNALLMKLTRRAGLDSDAMAGLEGRWGALLQGLYGPVFEGGGRWFSWQESLQPSAVSYLGVSALESPQDANLWFRILLQDLKAIIASRTRGNDPSTPMLLVIDEFAAVTGSDEMTEQALVDILLMARQARIHPVIATQFLPATLRLQEATSSLGLMFTLRTSPLDASQVAEMIGAVESVEVTHQLTGGAKATGDGTATPGWRFRVHPDALKTLTKGRVVLRHGKRVDVAQVIPVGHEWVSWLVLARAWARRVRSRMSRR